MQRSRPDGRVSPFLWLLIVIIAITLGLMFFLPPRFASRTSAEFRARIDVQNYNASLWAYSNAFGELPLGNNEAVTAALLGRNPSGAVFLSLRPRSTNDLGEFLDPARKPYMILVTTNRILIAPQPK